MTPAEEVSALRAKLKSREGKAGFGENKRQIEARIAELEKGMSNG